MNSISVYIYESTDPDLSGLLKQIGAKNFRKLVKLSLLALNNPEYIGKSKDCMEPGGDPPADTKSFRIIISLRDQKYDELKRILSQLKAKQLNNFIKQVVRFYVSPMDLLPFYFKEDVEFTQQMYKPLVINSVLDTTRKVRTRRQKQPKVPIMPPMMYPYGIPPAYYPYPQGSQKPEVQEQSITEPVITQTPVKQTPKTTETEAPVLVEKKPDEPFLDFSAAQKTEETPDDKQDEVLAMLSNLLG